MATLLDSLSMWLFSLSFITCSYFSKALFPMATLLKVYLLWILFYMLSLVPGNSVGLGIFSLFSSSIPCRLQFSNTPASEKQPLQLINVNVNKLVICIFYNSQKECMLVVEVIQFAIWWWLDNNVLTVCLHQYSC